MASSFMARFATRVSIPAASTLLFQSYKSNCEELPSIETPKAEERREKQSPKFADTKGFHANAQGDFHNLFPRRQLWQPSVEYPLWDGNWDGRQPTPLKDADDERRRTRQIRKEGVTRHIILIRHGQYDEKHKGDENRRLTELGKEQADLTGRRIAELVKGADEMFGPCRVKILHVSNMTRAKETADLIAQHLPSVERGEPDPFLNEGKPSHYIPGGKASPSDIAQTDEGHVRIEAAFQKYFYRKEMKEQKQSWAEDPEEAQVDQLNVTDADPIFDTENPSENTKPDEDDCKHEFEIIVCHANVIRYFTCRALQLPPEAWLRLCTFNCSLTYLTIRPTGTVSIRSLGDCGHLPYGKITFSMHHGYNW